MLVALSVHKPDLFLAVTNQKHTKTIREVQEKRKKNRLQTYLKNNIIVLLHSLCCTEERIKLQIPVAIIDHTYMHLLKQKQRHRQWKQVSSQKKCIDEMCHFMRRKQIKVLDIKWISKELLIAPEPQVDQLLLQPMLCIPNSHFTHLYTQTKPTIKNCSMSHCLSAPTDGLVGP